MHTLYINLGNYDFPTPGASCLPGYEAHEWDQAVHQLSLSFSATFGLDVPSYEDAITNDGTSLLTQLHPEPSLASLMPINDNNVIFIHFGQAEAGEFYANANAFYKDNYEKKMSFKEYFDLDGGTEKDKYILSLSMHPTDADVWSPYSPQYVDYMYFIVCSR